ncbi:unnamed protein product [Rodentolepis nana]|uniref:Endo/exonuclease/phosphatase domain-containing protein n=1 Tax=Rodentolepis nana TaxID=102285 RepID=A0A0R3T5S3_RODNA|nr:unnamed protein product [Rodentolepis nana]
MSGMANTTDWVWDNKVRVTESELPSKRTMFNVGGAIHEEARNKMPVFSSLHSAIAHFQTCIQYSEMASQRFVDSVASVSGAGPSVECWRDVTGQEDPVQKILQTYDVDLFTGEILHTYDIDIFTIMERQVASGILTGIKEGLTFRSNQEYGLDARSHNDLIKSMGSTQDIFGIIRLNSQLDLLNISHKTVALGDFNAHSTKWGYKDTNIAGKEIKDMLNSNPLELIFSNEDPATYLHYNGTRTTPDLLLASSGISEHTHRKIIDDPGSGHKPVIASITIGSKSMTRKMPTKLS